MRRVIFCLVLTFSGALQAEATTYDYVGQPFTSFTGGCTTVPSPCSNIIGSVTFNFDTSHFTGNLILSSGDTAFLTEGINPTSPLGPLVPVFPSSTILFNPQQISFVSELSGNFTLVNGSITSWALGGDTHLVGCGGGPGCESGSSSVGTTPTSDQSSAFQQASNAFGGSWGASNDGGGVWTEEGLAAVPEPSTWAMLLIGFAGIGFLSLQNRKRLSFSG
ncbi:PEP-CTERM sorting domain-containing protein [Bradyrhizobium erythrophlei]|uniref:PEP-CTERM sorting domain-containing protein n=1 Tax=Bradyrhizobium erythrophlei TaxID=1437360 RepID=UPI0012ABDB94|nr:PEP-CTERM sorting domain-containing protein [Bradyrhizobium erythrophlei]